MSPSSRGSCAGPVAAFDARIDGGTWRTLDKSSRLRKELAALFLFQKTLIGQDAASIICSDVDWALRGLGVENPGRRITVPAPTRFDVTTIIPPNAYLTIHLGKTNVCLNTKRVVVNGACKRRRYPRPRRSLVSPPRSCSQLIKPYSRYAQHQD